MKDFIRVSILVVIYLVIIVGVPVFIHWVSDEINWSPSNWVLLLIIVLQYKKIYNYLFEEKS